MIETTGSWFIPYDLDCAIWFLGICLQIRPNSDVRIRLRHCHVLVCFNGMTDSVSIVLVFRDYHFELSSVLLKGTVPPLY